MKKALLKGFIAFEVVALVGSYRVWHSMNTSQEYRKWMFEKYPIVLEGFYKTADFAGYGHLNVIEPGFDRAIELEIFKNLEKTDRNMECMKEEENDLSAKHIEPIMLKQHIECSARNETDKNMDISPKSVINRSKQEFVNNIENDEHFADIQEKMDKDKVSANLIEKDVQTEHMELSKCNGTAKAVKNNEEKKVEFAIPGLPTHKYSKAVKKHSKDEMKDIDTIVEKHENDNNKTVKNVKSLRKESTSKCFTPKFPYQEPIWSGIPCTDKKYSLTVLKNGIVKENIDVNKQSMMVFGRSQDCDVVLEHPSCSRYHTVLQYCTKEKDIRKIGYYLYDLGSTHGSFVNKEQVKPKVYVRIRVGYQIRFGGSSRLYIMEGPEEDQEEELDMDAIRQSRLQYDKNISKEKKRIGASSRNVLHEETDEGASWGFREDAEEEELDLKDLLEKKKNIEVKDPKKTLKGFFEREGIEFEYEMLQRAKGNSVVHVAQVRLPIETSVGVEVIAEGISSNKKDAVLLCATDACKLIQAYDIMQNSSHEDLHLKRQRELEANDFYDSDDDNYLDRTGSVERKRLKRIKRAGKVKNEEVETHDSLKSKLVEKEKLLLTLEEKLNLSREASEKEEEVDSLDAYMSSVKIKLDKKSESAIKINISALKKEVESLRNLVEITQPALPTFNVGEMIPENPNKDLTEPSSVDASDTDINNKEKSETDISKQKEEPTKTSNQKESISLRKKKKRIYGPAKPPDKKCDADFIEWLPPKDQTGDGRTHLNEKLGY